MAALIGALRVDLSADTAAFTNGMKRAEKQAQKSAGVINKSFSSIKTAAGGFLAGASLAALTAVTKKALDYASSLGEVAQQLGVTTKELQEYRYAATQAGISQEEMDKALAKLTQTMGKARTGAEGPKRAFDELSKILGKDILKNAKTAGDAIPMIADALSKVSDPAKRAAVEVALFGKAGQKLDTLLAGGAAGINNLRDAAHRLGIVLSDDQIQKADETADRLADLKQVLEARIAGVVADNAQSILSLANAFAELTTQIIRFNAQNPQVALGLIGAYLGGRFGPIGAAVGGVAGLAAGGYAERQGRDNNMDPSFRAKEYRASQARLAQIQQAGMDTRPARAEVLRQAQLMLRASKSGITPASGAPAAPVTGDPNINLAGGGSKKDNSAAEAERKRKDALREQHQNDMDIARSQMDELRAREDLAVETQDKASFALKQLELEHEIERKQIQFDLAMGDITQKQAEERELAEDRVFNLRKQKLTLDADMEVQEQRLRLEREMGEMALDGLQIEAGLAETARERREVEMRILDARLKLERQALQAVIDNERATEDEKQAARRRLQFLDTREPQMREGVRRDTEGPLARYMRTLPSDAAKLDEALQNVAVSGLGSIEDGILDVINGTKSLAAAFRDMAQSIISDLLRIAIQRSITIPLANALFGGGSSGIMSGPSVSGGGGILGSLLKIGGIFAGGISGGGSAVGKAAGNISKAGMGLKGFASGGSFQIGGRHGYDTNLLSLNGHPIARVSRGETMGIIPGGANDPRRMGGNSTFNITVPGGGTREDRRQTALQVGAEVRRIMTDSTRKGA